MTPPTLRALRAHAVAKSLRPAADIVQALAAMRFLQLDPIRAPARAADLILRQRVAGYRAGDLDRAYPALELAEDYLHVYGVMPRSTQELLHPRKEFRFRVEREHPRLASRVLAHIAERGETHPRDLAGLGGHRTTGGWGNDSVATTRVLEALHFRGKLRVVRRASGIKVYALAPSAKQEVLPPAVRAQALLRLLLDLYGPLPEPAFRQLTRMVDETSVSAAMRVRTLERLRDDPAVLHLEADGGTWLRSAGEPLATEIVPQVRFLAPFDPLVWDRRRFAEFWGWQYRFEAYTPVDKRKLGYYALPLLWRDEVIGWVNASYDRETLRIETGFARKAPREAAFRRELAAEAERLRECIGAAHLEIIR